jgi:hypothetical protein
MMRRLGAVLAAFASLGAALALAAATAAPASALGGIDCIGPQQVDFSPGITNTPQIVSIAIARRLGFCLSLTHPSITSGEIAPATLADVERSCTDLSRPAPGQTLTINWNDGSTSTIAYDATSTYVNGELAATQTGVVTSGTFAGYHTIALVTLFGDPLGCERPGGLTTLRGALLLAVKPPLL